MREVLNPRGCFPIAYHVPADIRGNQNRNFVICKVIYLPKMSTKIYSPICDIPIYHIQKDNSTIFKVIPFCSAKARGPYRNYTD